MEKGESVLASKHPDFSNEDFLEKAVDINQKVLRAAAVFAVVVELCNMLRVLVFTNAKLGTLNNRIYFGFYLIYFILSVLFLIVDIGIKMSPAARYRIYMIAGSVILLWHMSFNMYDIRRAGAVGNITVITALAIMFALLIMRPVYALLNLSIHYLIFALFLYSTLSSGEVINFTITTLLCGLIYFVRYHHLCIELSQARLIDDIQNELTETRKNFRLSLEQYELIREKENYVTFEWNIEKDCIYFSKEWRDWFDESEDIPQFSSYIQGRKTLAQDQKELILKCLEGVRKGVIFQKHELLLPLKTGKNGWFELRVITQMNDRNEPISGIGTLLDITLQKERISRLEQETRMDLFTGLLNKTAIERYGQQKLKELQEGEILAALILDMDDFKGINDNFGHPVGDYVLKEVAGIILKKAPAGAKVGRMGGDEFIVLLTTEELHLLQDYAGELIQAVSQIKWEDTDVGASCCVGISAADSDKWTYARLYQEADNALYQAKRRGRGQICKL